MSPSHRTRSHDREPFHNYRAHALDELRLARFHAEELARDTAEWHQVRAAFDAIYEQIARRWSVFPPPLVCGACRDAGKGKTGLECPVCVVGSAPQEM